MSVPHPSPPPRALTWRAVLVGLVLVVVFAVITPINDWRLDNTLLYSQHLPVGVFLLVVAIGLGLNPLLGRHRLRSGELLVVAGMLLVLGGVVSSGLNRLLTGVMAGPARLAATSTVLTPLRAADGTLAVPHGPYLGVPAQGPVPVDHPDQRLVIDGFMTGLPQGDPIVRHRATVIWRDADGDHRALALDAGAGPDDLDLTGPLGRALAGARVGAVVDGPQGRVEVLRIEPPGIPWAPWGSAFLHWAPLLGSAMIAFLAIAALVRRQWLHHERLPYPIAGVIGAYLEDPEPGRRLAPVFRQRAFWLGFAIAAAVLFAKGSNALGWHPFAIDTELRLGPWFNGHPWNKAWEPWILYTGRVYFSIIAVAFLLPGGLSFSLWFFYLLLNGVYIVANTNGAQIHHDHAAAAGIGGYAVEACLILWVGRRHYLQVLRAAFGLGGDPGERVLAVYAWILIAGLVGMVATMMAYGAHLDHALIAAAVYCGMALVLARIIAEAGIPFLNQPTSWGPASVIYSLTGLTVPAAALIPLTMLAQTMCSDSREALLPFAANAEALGDRARAPRLPWTAVLLLVLAIGTVVAGATMLWLGYHGDGNITLDNDNNWRSSVLAGVGPPATVASGGRWVEPAETWAAYGVGAAVTAALGVARLAWSWWPLHPIGFLFCASYAAGMSWFSFLIGWLGKALVMRYGGMQLYKRLKPLVYGLIAGEAVLAGLFLLLGIADGVFGWGLPQTPRFLPR